AQPLHLLPLGPIFSLPAELPKVRNFSPLPVLDKMEPYLDLGQASQSRAWQRPAPSPSSHEVLAMQLWWKMALAVAVLVSGVTFADDKDKKKDEKKPAVTKKVEDKKPDVKQDDVPKKTEPKKTTTTTTEKKTETKKDPAKKTETKKTTTTTEKKTTKKADAKSKKATAKKATAKKARRTGPKQGKVVAVTKDSITIETGTKGKKKTETYKLSSSTKFEKSAASKTGKSAKSVTAKADE